MTVKPPSATGVRVAGDRFQWQIAWLECMILLRDAVARTLNPVVSVGVEVDDVGNLDDVVTYHATPPHTYAQVKYAVDGRSPINEAYLTVPSPAGGPSLLQKIVRSRRLLATEDEPVDLALISNRTADPRDPLVPLRDSRTQWLMPRAGQGGPRSAVGAARRRWAEHTGLSEDELRELLGVLRFDLGREPKHLEEHIRGLMLGVGLRTDDAALHTGADWVARQVVDGHRELDREMINHAVDTLNLRAGPERAVVSVATLQPDPVTERADYALDWVDRFDGTSPFDKCRPRAPHTWAQLQQEIEAIPDHLPPGASDVAVTGSFRQAPGFLIGSVLRGVTGKNLAIVQNGQTWASTEPYDAPIAPITPEDQEGPAYLIDQGPDLAVLVAVATGATEDVKRFLCAQRIPVSRLLVYQPPKGPKDTAIPDAATANALAVGIRDACRRACRGAPRIHLFQAGPLGLSLLLGHRWNRLRPTVVYEHLRDEVLYEEAFTVDA